MEGINKVVFEEMENELCHLRRYAEDSFDVLFSRLDKLKHLLNEFEKKAQEVRK